MFKFEKKDGVIISLIYRGKDNVVIIPDTFEGEPVIYIETIIFYYSNFFDVVLPDSLVEIGMLSFSGCSNLKELNLTKNLTCVNNIIIQNCQNIKSIKVLNSAIRVEEVDIKKCDSLNEVSECLLDKIGKKTKLNVVVNKFENWGNLYQRRTKFCN